MMDGTSFFEAEQDNEGPQSSGEQAGEGSAQGQDEGAGQYPLPPPGGAGHSTDRVKWATSDGLDRTFQAM